MALVELARKSAVFALPFFGGIALVAVLQVPQASPALAEGNGMDGKAIFLAQKCNLCHGVEAQAVEKSNPKMKGPDLSSVGSEHDADWFKSFLKKETDLNGKKHMKEFKGTDEELQALVDWLAEQNR